MVLFRSPVQQPAARLTSPLVIVQEEAQPVHHHHHDEAEEEGYNALLLADETPGKPEHLWSQRIQESLNAVAASPSSKRNAPAPFASSSKLRRSPPAAHHVDQQHEKQPSQSAVMEAEDVQDPFVKRARVERTPPGATTAYSDTRESQSQSRALFDDRGSVEPAKAQHSSPSLGPALMPISTSLHRHRASLPDASILRSAPMVASTSRLSAQSTPTQQLASSLKRPGTPEVAKIGLLNARIALLESQKEAADAGREAVEVRNTALEEKCQFLEADQAEKQERLAEYEALAEEWEGTLNDYGAIQLEVEELRKRHLEDEAGLLQLREDQAERKLKEKKYRNELRWRQAESRWRDLTVVSKNKREAEVEVIAKNLKVIELTRAYNMERASSEYFKGYLDDMEEELHAAQEANDTLKQRSTSLSAKRMVAENKSAEASRKLAKLELDNAVLRKDNERLEDEVAQLSAAENASRATSGQVVDLQKQIRQRDKEVAKLSSERDNTTEQLKELKHELKSLKAELNQKDKKITSLEQRIEYDEEERRQLDAAREAEEQSKRDADLVFRQEQQEMHNRAKKAFGDSQSQASGSQTQTATTKSKPSNKGTKDGKKAPVDTKAAKAPKPKVQNKAATKMVVAEENDDEDESFGLPPPLSTSAPTSRDDAAPAVKRPKPKATANKNKAPNPVQQDDEPGSESDSGEDAPPPKKVPKKTGVAHPSKARKSMGRPSTQPVSDDGASKRKRVEEVEADSAAESAEEVARPPKKTKKAQDAGSTEPIAKSKEPQADAKATKPKTKKADSCTASGAGTKKTALFGGNKSGFVWDQTVQSKSILQNLPDHLSPIKPSR